MGSVGDLGVLARLHMRLRVRFPSCYRGCACQEKFECSEGQNSGVVLNSGVFLGSVSKAVSPNSTDSRNMVGLGRRRRAKKSISQ